jgi:hypothetical protein
LRWIKRGVVDICDKTRELLQRRHEPPPPALWSSG